MTVPETSSPVQSTPLTADHISRGARMAPFAGWNMPIQYDGIIAETLHTRSAVSCFDICHMGEFLLKGDPEACGLEHLVTARLQDMPSGSCRYGSILNEKGGVLDDLIVYRKGPADWMIVVNAATIEKDKKHFQAHLKPGTDFRDVSAQTGKIDLQGPLSRDIIKAIAPAATDIGYYTFIETEVLGRPALVSRTGYTGELGYELYVPAQEIPELWKKLLDDPRVKPAGLGARDVLRLEMGYSLYGQDINEETTPLDAGLEKFVDFKKDFIGKSALESKRKTGTTRQRVFLRTLSRRSPRHEHHIFVDGQTKGIVTSGTFSPHLNCGIGMGFLENIPAARALNISVGDDKVQIEAVITDKPFVKHTSLKQ
ncbi:MAG: glycine cleavage system aminomethyltransferase GcvT [Candidatus Omnitrophica bacterium]|nr:glycine cleavage system aminomethyltransferase GcvT [Candidatus Omnitrophota bacterium]